MLRCTSHKNINKSALNGILPREKNRQQIAYIHDYDCTTGQPNDNIPQKAARKHGFGMLNICFIVKRICAVDKWLSPSYHVYRTEKKRWKNICIELQSAVQINM